MTFDYRRCTERELWRHVGAHLERRGIDTVLVGGAVVAVYSEGAYRSGDLDFVAEGLVREEIGPAMSELGFERRGRHFEHPECPHLFVEFVAGPLGIGDDLAIVPREERVGDQTLRILSPTDCVRDRLASAIHFRARECLDQAVLVAAAQDIDWPVVHAWCLAEGPEGRRAYEDLLRLLPRSHRAEASGDGPETLS